MPPALPATKDWFDPFDLWAVPVLGRMKSRWYEGSRLAKLALFGVYTLDWFAPHAMRAAFGVKPACFAHSLALLRNTQWSSDSETFLDTVASGARGHAWGLPFAWFSKNGVYPVGIPLVTATPYVMHALLDIDPEIPSYTRAREMFHDSWHFLNDLGIHEDTDSTMALSYAPFADQVTVINANSYAAWAYAMHTINGLAERRELASDRALRLARWVVRQQNPDGSWYYLAERGDWDMIDGFHSCFVVRNLISAGSLLPDVAALTEPAIQGGWKYIRTHLFDETSGFCRRYSTRHRPDPFRYDIYDQAEYLGLLIDFGELDAARDFADRVTARFTRNGHWYCRIDMFGRLWGRDFLRWGIVPFLHHRARLDRLLSKAAT